jgi:hypothetical protein
MSTETKLRTAMAEAVAPENPDTDHLVAAARRRGLGIRRRRQALAGVGIAAALALAVAAPTVVAGDHGRNSTDAMQVATSPASFDSQDTRPLTGRSAAAALFYAVGLTAAGEGTDFRGASAVGPAGPEAYTIFRFTPSGSTTAGEVAVNIDPPVVDDVAKPGDTSREHPGACQSFMTDCVSTRLADGSRLTTYDDLSSHGAGIRRVAELLRPNGVRVLASATNGYDVTELDEQISRDEPVLTTDQLVDVVTQPWWGLRLPMYFTAQGEKLSPYSDRSASAMATPTEAPTKAE